MNIFFWETKRSAILWTITLQWITLVKWSIWFWGQLKIVKSHSKLKHCTQPAINHFNGQAWKLPVNERKNKSQFMQKYFNKPGMTKCSVWERALSPSDPSEHLSVVVQRWEREVILLYLINVFFCFGITDWLVSSLKHNVLLWSGQKGKVRGKRKRKKSIWNSRYKSQWALKI